MVDKGISESFQRPCLQLNFKRSHNLEETLTPSECNGILHQSRTLRSRLCVTLMPIIRWRRQPPNILRFFQIDSAVSRVLWIDIHDGGYRPFACEKDMNTDFHAHAQCDGCQNQGAMKVNDEGFAFAC